MYLSSTLMKICFQPYVIIERYILSFLIYHIFLYVLKECSCELVHTLSTHMIACVDMHTHPHTHTHTHTHAHMHTHPHTPLPTHPHIHTHTHTRYASIYQGNASFFYTLLEVVLQTTCISVHYLIMWNANQESRGMYW